MGTVLKPLEISRNATPDYCPQWSLYPEEGGPQAAIVTDPAYLAVLAAAPDLLAALQDLAGLFPYFPAGSEERAALAAAQTAIAKARGE
jgi:hypothetical protein